MEPCSPPSLFSIYRQESHLLLFLSILPLTVHSNDQRPRQSIPVVLHTHLCRFFFLLFMLRFLSFQVPFVPTFCLVSLIQLIYTCKKQPTDIIPYIHLFVSHPSLWSSFAWSICLSIWIALELFHTWSKLVSYTCTLPKAMAMGKGKGKKTRITLVEYWSMSTLFLFATSQSCL